MIDEKILLSLAFRIKLVSWCLSPRLVGCPLPKFSIEFVQRLSKLENLHLDIRRSIVSCSVSYFQFQSISGAGPYHFEELYSSMESLHSNARDTLTPLFCKIAEPEIVNRVINQAKIFRDLFPPTQNPEEYVILPIQIPIRMPSKDKWAPLEQRFIQQFIGSGLLAQNQAVLQLTVHLLTDICVRGGEVSKNIAPFISRSLKRFDPSCGFVSLISFSFSFCFLPFHQDYTETIDEFINIFSKTRNHFDNVNKTQIKRIWEGSIESSAYQPLDTVISEYVSSFNLIIDRAISQQPNERKEFIKVVHLLSKRIAESINLSKRPLYQTRHFEELKNILRILTHETFFECASADTFNPQSFNLLLNFIEQNHVYISHIHHLAFVYNLLHLYTNCLQFSHFSIIGKWNEDISKIPTIFQFIKDSIQHYLINNKSQVISDEEYEFISLFL